jgi:hypothetical protein
VYRATAAFIALGTLPLGVAFSALVQLVALLIVLVVMLLAEELTRLRTRTAAAAPGR